MVFVPVKNKLSNRLRPLVKGGRRLLLLPLLFSLFAAAPSAAGSKPETLVAPQAFIQNAFHGDAPKPKVLWLKRALQEDIEKIMDHRLAALRLRYWRKDGRTAWILEELGKEEPITAGFVVEDDRLLEANVLIYRESRGWEVKYPAFRNQFAGAMLDDNRDLTNNIDGISGATLSVNAMKRMARLALYLHGQVTDKAARS